MKKIFAAAASAALLVSGVAQASSAQSLSLKNAPRASSEVRESNSFIDAAPLIIGLIIAAAVATIIITNDSDSN